MSKWYVECDCKTHLIGIETWDTSVCLAFFEMGHPDDGRTSIKYKWQLIRQILKKGHPYMDSVLFHSDTVDELIKILKKARAEVIAHEKEEEKKAQEQEGG